MDYRPLFEYENRPSEVPFTVRDAAELELPFQEVRTEHTSMISLPWRKRVVLPLEIPACGWQIVRLGKAKEKALPVPAKNICTAGGADSPWIANAFWKIGVDPQKGLRIERAAGGEPCVGIGPRAQRHLDAVGRKEFLDRPHVPGGSRHSVGFCSRTAFVE